MQKRSIKAPIPPADAPPRDTRALVRLGLWGAGAAGALLVAALATITDNGQRRLSLAYASLNGAAPQPSEAERRISAREREMEAETRRLNEALRHLAEDRDRLLARMTALERNYEDVTGSIGKLMNAPKPAAEPPPLPSAPPEIAPAASVPAAAPQFAREAPAASAEPEPVPTRSEFGVDLGGGPTIAALRAAWNQIRRNHSTLLDGLRPIVAVRDGRGSQAELRLVVGPINNAAAAAKLCAALAAAGLSCQPTMFEGQRLALR